MEYTVCPHYFAIFTTTNIRISASYDYGSSIAESRELTSKFDELKLQGVFLRSSPEFSKTDWIADSTTGITTTNPAAFITLLQNPDTKAAFYIARQADSTSTFVRLTIRFCDADYVCACLGLSLHLS